MTPAERVIKKFGGLTSVAKALDYEVTRQAVFYWKTDGYIPSRFIRRLLKVAKKRDLKLDLKDMI